MGRYENVSIFEDTVKCYENDHDLKKVVASQIASQKLVREQDKLSSHKGEVRFQAPATVVVSRKRSFEAAGAYRDQRVCVMNFASATNPGGGVTRGSTAQEECLCRTSTLYAALNCQAMWNGFYNPHRRTGDPLHNDDCIYTPGVMVFKTDSASPERMLREQWFQVDVLTVAAPNLREKPSNQMNPGEGNRVRISDRELQALHERRLRRVFDLAVEQGAEVLILGAFGCGAFQNPPQVVAAAMRNVLRDYRNCFQTVEFAVYCSPRDDTNFRVFQQILDGEH